MFQRIRYCFRSFVTIKNNPGSYISNPSVRLVQLEVPDLEEERLLRRTESKENFDEIFPKIKLPSKLNRDPELAKTFVYDRLQQNPNGYPQIPLDTYESVWTSIIPNDGSTISEDIKERMETIRKEIQMILIYYNNVLRTSLFAPSTIPIDDMMKMIFKYDSHRSRLRYVQFLFIREFDSYSREIEERRKSEIRRQQEELEYFEHVGCFADPHTGQQSLQYGYWRNTLFTRYFRTARHKQTIQILRQIEQIPESQQPIIIDCSLESLMEDYEILSCQRQISKIYHMNRYSRHPFRLFFTGFDPKTNRTFEYLYKNMKEFLERPEFFFNISPESYLQLLPDEHERFIYLSPDAREIMTEFDPQAVYIIGALVSKTYKASLTLDKARQEGLRCLRLPLHHHVRLKPCVKRILSFQGVFKILLMLKHGADWPTALRSSIQTHKLMDDDMDM